MAVLVMSDVLFALSAVGAIIAAAAGVVKVARPHNTVIAVEAVTGLAVPSQVIRAASAGEVVIAVAALAGSAVGLALLSVSYLAFAAFVLTALARDQPVSSCGCFGEADVPPTVGHVAFDATVAGVAGLAATGNPRFVGDVLASQPFHGVPLVSAVLGASVLGWIFLAQRPKSTDAPEAAP